MNVRDAAILILQQGELSGVVRDRTLIRMPTWLRYGS